MGKYLQYRGFGELQDIVVFHKIFLKVVRLKSGEYDYEVISLISSFLLSSNSKSIKQHLIVSTLIWTALKIKIKIALT